MGKEDKLKIIAQLRLSGLPVTHELADQMEKKSEPNILLAKQLLPAYTSPNNPSFNN